jgi:hypothetical protein
VEETRAGAKVSRRELEERLAEVTAAVASADQRYASRAAADAAAAAEERRDLTEQLWWGPRTS